MFSSSLRQRFPSSHLVLLDELAHLIEALETNSERTFSANLIVQARSRTCELYNSYVDFALAVYVDKFKQLYRCVAQSLEQEWYLVYAQSGRAILENAAVLRYYARQKELEELHQAGISGLVNDDVLRRGINTVDRFVRGNRFSWDAFIEARFDELNKNPHQEGLLQVHVLKCLQEWYKESPKLEKLYDLLCDLVHPNLGSNYLVMRSCRSELVAGGVAGSHVSMFIVCPTLAGIIGAYKNIQNDLVRLESLKIPT